MKRLILLLCCTLGALAAHAEQMQKLGTWEVHYIALPSTTLKASIAARYNIKRARDVAFVNISILDEAGRATTATLEGAVTNLLSQRTPLAFQEVIDGDAIYYLATLRYTDQEVLRFAIDITPPGDRTRTLNFRQTIYWDE